MDSPTLERHPTLYFPDGDIVLCAAAKSGTYHAFRVDRVYLIRSSPVLRDMLAGPSPGSVTSGDVFDGVPMLRLNDDASELASLLELLYNTVTVSLQRLDPNNPLRAMGILRLATKYAMDPLRKIILHCIQADWPRTLQEWDHLQATVEHARELKSTSLFARMSVDGEDDDDGCSNSDDTSPSPAASAASSSGTSHSHGSSSSGGPYLDDCFPEPAAAIRFATEFGCPGILPAAFYQLAITEPTADWDEYRRCDDADAWEHRCALATGGRTARWALLDRAALMRLLRGRTALDAWLPDVEDCLTSYLGTAECVDAHHCGRVRADVHRAFLLDGPGRARPFDPLHALRFLLDLVPQHQFCGACLRHIRGELLRVRQEIWDELPAMFGIVVGPAPPCA